MLVTDYCHEPKPGDPIGSPPLSRDRLISLVRDRITLRQQEALFALNRDGEITTINPHYQRFLQEISHLRVDHHVIAELALPGGGNNRWFATSLGCALRERLEREPL